MGVEDRMMKHFSYDHLPSSLRDVSIRFHNLASYIVESLEPGPERTIALRKLLEAKDAAVRSKIYPGG